MKRRVAPPPVGDTSEHPISAPMPQRPSSARHIERQSGDRVGWLRAAVLGANDGIVSTASLLVGVAAASSTLGAVLVAGIAGLVAGAMSMAAGEYVSVKSQADAEEADLSRERAELAANKSAELHELASIYVQRGLDPQLAHQVAVQLTAKDALGGACAGRVGHHRARRCPAGAGSNRLGRGFATGAALPVLVAVLAPIARPRAVDRRQLAGVSRGARGARGARRWRPDGIGAARVTFWGAAAMAATAAVGSLFGTAVA